MGAEHVDKRVIGLLMLGGGVGGGGGLRGWGAGLIGWIGGGILRGILE